MIRLRALTALLLALTLGLTSLTLAAARGHASAANEVEICTGQGLQMIRLDGEGNPAGPPHVCPDGVTAFVTLWPAAPAPVWHRTAGGEGPGRPPAHGTPAPAPRRHAAPRGPPVPV